MNSLVVELNRWPKQILSASVRYVVKLRLQNAVLREPVSTWLGRAALAFSNIVIGMMTDRRYGMIAQKADANRNVCFVTK